MIRRYVLAGALALGATTFAAPPADAIYCSPTAADVCATVAFVCGRLEYHRLLYCTIN